MPERHLSLPAVVGILTISKISRKFVADSPPQCTCAGIFYFTDTEICPEIFLPFCLPQVLLHQIQRAQTSVFFLFQEKKHPDIILIFKPAFRIHAFACIFPRP